MTIMITKKKKNVTEVLFPFSVNDHVFTYFWQTFAKLEYRDIEGYWTRREH